MTYKRIHITYGFIVFVAVLFYLDRGVGLLAPGIFVCVLHELGHVIAIYLMGGRIKRVRLSVVGAEMVMDSISTFSYFKEAVAAAAGPVMSFLTAWMAAKRELYLIAGLSLTAGVFNFLPIWPMDGGRVLLAFLCRFSSMEKAESAVRFVSLCLVCILLGLGIYLLYHFGNPTLLFTSFFLFFGAIKKFF